MLYSNNLTQLNRLLRALASVGIFAETESCSFTLTPLGTYLQSCRIQGGNFFQSVPSDSE